MFAQLGLAFDPRLTLDVLVNLVVLGGALTAGWLKIWRRVERLELLVEQLWESVEAMRQPDVTRRRRLPPP